MSCISSLELETRRHKEQNEDTSMLHFTCLSAKIIGKQNTPIPFSWQQVIYSLDERTDNWSRIRIYNISA
jgi:hypothetical protein